MLTQRTIKNLWAKSLIAGGFIPSKLNLGKLRVAVEHNARLVEAQALENAAKSNGRVTDPFASESYIRATDLRAAARRCRKAAGKLT